MQRISAVSLVALITSLTLIIFTVSEPPAAIDPPIINGNSVLYLPLVLRDYATQLPLPVITEEGWLRKLEASICQVGTHYLEDVGFPMKALLESEDPVVQNEMERLVDKYVQVQGTAELPLESCPQLIHVTFIEEIRPPPE
ncbi:MAG: hypothetical protein ACE5MB_04855 [Anaerolineae bacterium]